LLLLVTDINYSTANYDVKHVKPSVFWKILAKGPLPSFLGGGGGGGLG